MVRYFLSNSFFLVALTGIGVGVAVGVAIPLPRRRRRFVVYRQRRRTIVPVALIGVFLSLGALVVGPPLPVTPAEWRLTAFSAAAWFVVVLAAILLRSYFKLLVVVPLVTVFVLSGVLWIPKGISPEINPPESMEVFVSEGTEPSGSSTTLLMVRIQQALGDGALRSIVLPVAPLVYDTVSTLSLSEGRFTVEVQLASPHPVLWWLLPRGAPLLVRLEDVVLVRYPPESFRRRILSALEEVGAVQRVYHTTVYPREVSHYLQPGVYFVSIVPTALRISTGSTDDL